MFNYMRSNQIERKIPVLVTPPSMPPSITQPEPISVMPVKCKPTPIEPTLIEDTTNITCTATTLTPPPACTYTPPPASVIQNHDDMEMVYLQKMYPPTCKKIQAYVNNELNKYDHELSPIYEIYPAQETIDYMANTIYSDIKNDMPDVIKEYECTPNNQRAIGGAFYTLAYVLLLNELYRRRMRQHLYSPTPYSTRCY